ncbi:MAG: HAD hydrolase-like protein [Lachnospiraceae bacterium]|nr:HAD hydrolase-like protein [Lachnospiraceae bacterium]
MATRNSTTRGFDAVLWDVDGTLLNFLYAQRCAISKCLQEIGVEPTEEIIARYSAINDGYWKRLELGEVTKEQLLTGRFTSLFEEYDIRDVDVQAFRDQYEGTLGVVYAYQENSPDICKALRGRVRQYVITNGVTSVQRSKLQLSGFAELMEDIFISEQIGVPKPQEAFFDACIRRMEAQIGAVDRSRLLIVGDSLSSDIKGGVLSGIPTCWYRPEDALSLADAQTQRLYAQYRPDYEISRLAQILDIV